MTKEEIAYDLKYYGYSKNLYINIVETIYRLPADVQEYVLDNCVFLGVGDTTIGTVLHGKYIKGNWIVNLLESVDKCSIAHEIAHAFLEHDRLSPPNDCEQRACELTAQWGFSGKGADYERYMQGQSEV